MPPSRKPDAERLEGYHDAELRRRPRLSDRLAGWHFVLDPGHGGVFRGVVGRDGFSEADGDCNDDRSDCTTAIPSENQRGTRASRGSARRSASPFTG